MDIRNGLSDAELMSRHEIDSAQLRKFFAKLIEAGYIAPEALGGRSHDETGAAFAEAGANAAQTTRPERSFSKPPDPVQPGPHPEEPHPHPGAQLRKNQDDALSLPMSREQAHRLRRNGFILILASFAFITMGMILAQLRAGPTLDSFAKDDLGGALALMAPVGWIVTAVLGCLWRVRGLGHHAAWAIVAPFHGINVLVMEALPNRYEPDVDRRVWSLAFAVGGLAAWTIVLSQVVKFL
jgi:hypothetical protein